MQALVVLSGGQDSTTCLFWAKTQGYDEVHALTFAYGQRHQLELQASVIIAAMAGVSHEILNLGPHILTSSSPLTDHDAPLETYKDFAEMDSIIGDRVEKTFVPMRNALFLVLAANRAVASGYDQIITGVCQQDNANYPDCRRRFIDDMEIAINSALGHDMSCKVAIRTPLMQLTKAGTCQLAATLPGCMEALAFSHTAYDGQYPPVSHDHASLLRAQGFLEAGLPDPLVLRAHSEGLMPLPNTANYTQAAYEQWRDSSRG